jgi:predicted helicase
LAFVSCSGFAQALIAHTSTKPVKKRKLLGRITEVGLDRWLSMSAGDWGIIHRNLRGEPARPTAKAPRPHQDRAIKAAIDHFETRQAARGRMIMPCGTGKSLTAFWIAQALYAKNILVAVPSLALIKQGVEDWTREFVALGLDPQPRWLCVCSDESTGIVEKDEFVSEVYDLGIPATTQTDEIEEFFTASTGFHRVVFVTYQSSRRLAEVTNRLGIEFDLGVFDEAHKTVGVKSKAFSILLHDENIRIRRRMFMTATERVVRGDNDEVFSMDDEAAFGRCFFQLTFKEAIHSEPPIICDYRIVTYAVTMAEVAGLIGENRLITDTDLTIEEAEAREVAAGIALLRAFRDHNVTHAVSFHRSIRAAAEFQHQQQRLSGFGSHHPLVRSFHISSRSSAGLRASLLKIFETTKLGLMTNARCLTEGIDIPAVDCVMFADPKQSTVDIVQAAGRALRPLVATS